MPGSGRRRRRRSATARPRVPDPARRPGPGQVRVCRPIATARAIRCARGTPRLTAGTAAAARRDSRARWRSAGTPAGAAGSVRRRPLHGRPRRWTDPVAEAHRRGARWARRPNGRRPPPPRSARHSSRAQSSIARRRWPRQAAADTRTSRGEEVDGPRDGSLHPLDPRGTGFGAVSSGGHGPPGLSLLLRAGRLPLTFERSAC